jgi:hypothetical protein
MKTVIDFIAVFSFLFSAGAIMDGLMTKGEIPDFTLVAVCAVCGTIALGFYALRDRLAQPDSVDSASKPKQA